MKDVVGSQKIDLQDGGKWWGFSYISQLRGEARDISHGKEGTAQNHTPHTCQSRHRSLTH